MRLAWPHQVSAVLECARETLIAIVVLGWAGETAMQRHDLHLCIRADAAGD